MRDDCRGELVFTAEKHDCCFVIEVRLGDIGVVRGRLLHATRAMCSVDYPPLHVLHILRWTREFWSPRALRFVCSLCCTPVESSQAAPPRCHRCSLKKTARHLGILPRDLSLVLGGSLKCLHDSLGVFPSPPGVITQAFHGHTSLSSTKQPTTSLFDSASTSDGQDDGNTYSGFESGAALRGRQKEAASVVRQRRSFSGRRHSPLGSYRKASTHTIHKENKQTGEHAPSCA